MQYDDHARPVDFVYLDVNEAFERLTGLKNVVGKPVSEVIPGIRELSPELFEAYGRVASTGIPETFEFDFKSQSQWLIISVYSPARGTFVAVFDDITERKRAEAELRLQSAALNAAANGIVITDRDGSIAWINPAFTALTGYSAEEAIGKNPRELVKSGVHDQAFYKHLWDTILTGNVWHGEMTNRRKDGTLYAEDMTITPVKDAGGEITHFIAIKRDLTEEKRLEAQFLQAQKMESVGRLAGGIAHDFNNLLTVINGTADLASMKLREGDPLRTVFLHIRQAGDRAASLTRQLLAFSRKQIMKPEVLNLSTLVADLRSMLQRLIREDIDLVVVPAQDLGSVRADPGQIEQVVINLVVNARDAMPDGGTLTIETRDVQLDEAQAGMHPSMQPGPHVMLAVSDTGVGMDEATRMRIFEPFFTTKEQGKGTGLGLATVYGIVKQSGGSIWVYSELGKGTTFKIYLPRVGEVARTVRRVRTLTAVPGTETILIVEDEEVLRDLATHILQSAGYTVLTASSGGEALLLLEHHDGPVHLVLTDVVLPGISGLDLAKRVAEAHPEIKVLFTSGYTNDAILRNGVLDKLTHFIGKPYTMAELTHKVREVLDAPVGHPSRN
jgi:PAS domain S-box-containing protein